MKYLSILFVCIFLMNCSSVPKEYVTNNDTCGNINTLFEPLDNGNTLPKDIQEKLKTTNELFLKNNEAFENRFSKSPYSKKTINYQTYKKFNIAKWIIYNKEGNVRLSEFVYRNGNTRLYKETQFDSIGNITKVIDHEKGYSICWAEAIEIVKKIAKRDIRKYEATDYYLRRVNMNKWPNEKPQWGVSFKGNDEYNAKPLKVYWVDGVTGRFLRTTEITMIP